METEASLGLLIFTCIKRGDAASVTCKGEMKAETHTEDSMDHDRLSFFALDIELLEAWGDNI